MEITLEKIDNLRERANVSYKEAKEALEQNDGNMIDAIIYLECENKTVYDRVKKETDRAKEKERINYRKEKYKSNTDDFLDSCKKLLKSLNETRVVMYNTDRVILDISMTVTIFAMVFAFPLTIAVFVLGLVFGNRFKIIRKDKKADILNQVLNKAAKVSQDVADNLKGKVQKENKETVEEQEETKSEEL